MDFDSEKHQHCWASAFTGFFLHRPGSEEENGEEKIKKSDRKHTSHVISNLSTDHMIWYKTELMMDCGGPNVLCTTLSFFV